MQCRIHPENAGVNTCSQCGEWLCDACTVNLQGRVFCRKCLAKLTEGAEGAYGPVKDAEPVFTYAEKPRHIFGGLLFLFSFIPGVNYMYLGLIKRGLAVMVGFFLLIYFITVSPFPLLLLLVFSIPVYYLTSLFHSFGLRRRINAGEAVGDSIDDVVNFLRRNKGLIIGFIILLFGVSIAGSLIRMVLVPILRYLPVIVILIGLYVIFKKPKKKKDD